MLDIKLIRENPEQVQTAAKNKGVDVDIAKILDLDKKRLELNQTVQKLQQERNALTKNIHGKPTPEQIEDGVKIRKKWQSQELALGEILEELKILLLGIPNFPKPDVKIGKDESENEILRKYKEPTKFAFIPKDHLELGETLNIIDVKSAAKVSGARFAYLKNEAVLLEFALVQFALETLVKEGFTPVIPPALIKREITEGLGYWQAGGHEDYFWVNSGEKDEGFYLIGTAEHSLVPMHKDDLLEIKKMPIRYVGFSPAFRREAGTYGKDTKGILRVHQFDKIEMVSFVAESDDDKEHEYLLSLEEKLFQALDIPYQVIKMCTGDLGFPAARKYDIEAWIPSQNKYREVTSVSTVTDFQSRRLNIKYIDYVDEVLVGDQQMGSTPVGESSKREVRKHANILNGTAFAIGRTIIAILENYQQEDGSVVIPEVLRKYIGKDVIKKQ